MSICSLTRLHASLRVGLAKPQTPHPLNAYNQFIDTDGEEVETESERPTKVYETKREGDS